MEKSTTWEKIKLILSDEKEFELPYGKPFKASFKDNEIVITPTETGIQRRIGIDEWNNFVDKFNEVESGPYGHRKFKPGYYTRVTYNSSYLVTIAKSLQ